VGAVNFSSAKRLWFTFAGRFASFVTGSERNVKRLVKEIEQGRGGNPSSGTAALNAERFPRPPPGGGP
jgi:hypothetical protein